MRKIYLHKRFDSFENRKAVSINIINKSDVLLIIKCILGAYYLQNWYYC